MQAPHNHPPGPQQMLEAHLTQARRVGRSHIGWAGVKDVSSKHKRERLTNLQP